MRKSDEGLSWAVAGGFTGEAHSAWFTGAWRLKGRRRTSGFLISVPLVTPFIETRNF